MYWRVDQIMTTIQSLELRLVSIEHCTKTVTNNDTIRNSSITNPFDCTDLRVTASGIPISEDGSLLHKANELIRALGEEYML